MHAAHHVLLQNVVSEGQPPVLYVKVFWPDVQDGLLQRMVEPLYIVDAVMLVGAVDLSVFDTKLLTV